MDDLAMLKIDMVGLKADAADKLPSELPGGMIKRASLAARLLSIRILSFSTSRPRGSTRSALRISTNSLQLCNGHSD